MKLLSFSNYSAGLLFASWLSVLAKVVNAGGGNLIGSLVGCTADMLALNADVNLATAWEIYQSSMSFLEPDDGWGDLSGTVSFSKDLYQAYQHACLVTENTFWDAYPTTTKKCVYGDTLASFTIHNYGECLPTTGACEEIAARGEAMEERLSTLLQTFGFHCKMAKHTDTGMKDTSGTEDPSGGTEDTSGTELDFISTNLLTSAALSNSATPMALFSAASVATFLTMMLN